MLRPTGNKILIEIEKVSADFVKKDGIFMPGKTVDEARTGTVVALGSGNRNAQGNVVPFEIVIGDVILIGKFGGMEVKLGDKIYLLATEDEILGKIINE